MLIPGVSKTTEDLRKTEREWLEKLAEPELKKLFDKGSSPSLSILSGNPREVLVAEAEAWRADCIFVGANASGGRLQRFLLGTTSAAVAARAHCSVEAVRIASAEVLSAEDPRLAEEIG
jgi:nucleotide-binding universal stress UspA family protein